MFSDYQSKLLSETKTLLGQIKSLETKLFLSHVRSEQNAKWRLPMVNGDKMESFMTTLTVQEAQREYQNNPFMLEMVNATARCSWWIYKPCKFKTNLNQAYIFVR